MATTNKGLEQPARGSLVGVWDTPVNGNMDIIDASFGGAVSIALTNSPVVLSSAQYRNAFITFTGALSGNCAISFPNVGSFYTVLNLTSNTSAFQVTLQSTVAGTQVVGAPWGEPFDIMTDLSGNVRFKNLDRIGAFWDFIGSSVPAWVSNCTVPPYLNCDGTTFSSGTYPVLTTILGGTTLPDARGRTRFSLNQGTARITSSGGFGIDGNTNLSGGGTQTFALANLPNTTFPTSDAGHSHNTFRTTLLDAGPFTVSIGVPSGSSASATQNNVSAVTGVNVYTGGSGSPTLPPGYAAGITMIRAG